MPPREPTEVLERRGAFERNPQRRRPVGPKSERELGEPPSSMTDEEVACWHEVVGNAPAGVLTSAERIVVEIAARLLVKFRRGETSAAEVGHLRGCMASLGCTSVDRSRVSVAKADDDDPHGFFTTGTN